MDIELIEICISAGHDYWTTGGAGRLQHGMQTPARVECVAGKGLVGDRYFHGKPNRKGQVTFFEAEVVDEIRERFNLPNLPASIFRRNLIVRGVRLSDLLGQNFCVQGVEFQGSQECRPCEWMDRVVEDGARRFMAQNFRGGLRAKVIRGGTLQLRNVTVQRS